MPPRRHRSLAMRWFRRLAGLAAMSWAAFQLRDIPALVIHDYNGLLRHTIPAAAEPLIGASIALSTFLLAASLLIWGRRPEAFTAAALLLAGVWTVNGVFIIGAESARKAERVRAFPGNAWLITDTGGSALKIRARQDVRTYLWDECSFQEELGSRPFIWNGSLGRRVSRERSWSACGGIVRVVSEEGVRHFEDAETALRWLRAKASWADELFDEGGHAVSEDGLVLVWAKDREEGQLNVDIWQVYIRGRKPERFGIPDRSPPLIKVAA